MYKLTAKHIVLGLTVAGSCSGQQVAANPVRVKPIKPRTVFEKLLRLASKASGQTFGLELVESQSVENAKPFNFPGGTVADLISSLSATSPHLKWKLDAMGSVVFYNYKGAAQVPALKVNLKIAQDTQHSIWDAVGESEEFKAWLQVNGCRRLEISDGYRWKGDDTQVSLAPGPLPLETLLSKVATDPGHKISYIVRADGPDGCYVSIGL